MPHQMMFLIIFDKFASCVINICHYWKTVTRPNGSRFNLTRRSASDEIDGQYNNYGFIALTTVVLTRKYK